MDKTELYNLALDEFNIRNIADSDVENEYKRETGIFDLHYMQALSRVCTEHDWSWTGEVVEFNSDSDVGPKAGYSHCYVLPSGITRILEVPTDNEYRIVGSNLLTNDSVGYVIAQKLESIASFKNESIPYDFWVLVAQRLALESCPSIANGDERLINQITVKYNLGLQTLALSDAQHSQRRFA